MERFCYTCLHAYKALVILCIDEVTANWNSPSSYFIPFLQHQTGLCKLVSCLPLGNSITIPSSI